jgi:hypothetical protein
MLILVQISRYQIEDAVVSFRRRLPGIAEQLSQVFE